MSLQLFFFIITHFFDCETETFPPSQNFLAANSQCWWNTPLTAATRSLKYAGHVAPGMLLVTAEPCALEILRGAYARSVLKPPATYTISSVGEFRVLKIFQQHARFQFSNYILASARWWKYLFVLLNLRLRILCKKSLCWSIITDFRAKHTRKVSEWRKVKVNETLALFFLGENRNAITKACIMSAECEW